MLETSTRLKPSWQGDSEGLSTARLTFQSIHLNNPSILASYLAKSRQEKTDLPQEINKQTKKKAFKGIFCNGFTNTQDAESKKSCQQPLMCFRMELKVSQQAEKLCDTWTRGTETVHTLTYFSLDNCSVHFHCWGKIQTPKGKKKREGQQFSCTVHSQKSYSFSSSKGLTLSFGCKWELAAGRGRRENLRVTPFQSQHCFASPITGKVREETAWELRKGDKDAP